jgi:hypothetical protein
LRSDRTLGFAAFSAVVFCVRFAFFGRFARFGLRLFDDLLRRRGLIERHFYSGCSAAGKRETRRAHAA